MIQVRYLVFPDCNTYRTLGGGTGRLPGAMRFSAYDPSNRIVGGGRENQF
jgi:hypothetical protein